MGTATKPEQCITTTDGLRCTQIGTAQPNILRERNPTTGQWSRVRGVKPLSQPLEKTLHARTPPLL